MSDAEKKEEQAPQTSTDSEPTKKMKDRWRQTSNKSLPALEEGDVPGGRVGLPGREMDDDIERELAEAMGGMSPEDLLGEPGQQKQEEPEEPSSPRKKGKIYRVTKTDVFVDVPGGRTQGVIPLADFPADKTPEVGADIEFSIEGARDGLLLLSMRGAVVQADWDSVAEGMTVEARVLETNKGGLSVDINGIRGFMPISQIDRFRVENAEQFVNQRLLCVVTEANREERNLVVSRRALLEAEVEEQREKFWTEVEPGQTRQGVVRMIKDFGAFVDLGGVDGLLHISEMSWSRIKHPSEVVHEGQTLEVRILKVDHEKRRLGLGLKQLVASPWDGIHDKYSAGQQVEGKVTRLMDFGAFVQLEPGVEGLVHISELAPQRVHRVSDIVEVDQQISVIVLDVDAQNRRIALSLKATQIEPEEEQEEEEEEYTMPETPRRSTGALRGGVGSTEFVWPGESEEDSENEQSGS